MASICHWFLIVFPKSLQHENREKWRVSVTDHEAPTLFRGRVLISQTQMNMLFKEGKNNPMYKMMLMSRNKTRTEKCAFVSVTWRSCWLWRGLGQMTYGDEVQIRGKRDGRVGTDVYTTLKIDQRNLTVAKWVCGIKTDVQISVCILIRKMISRREIILAVMLLEKEQEIES